MVDREFAGSISTRKLVLETAKLNVITAYSYAEALATLEVFPRLHAVVVSSDAGLEAEDFLVTVRDRYPAMKRILTGEMATESAADVHVESFAPDKLLAATRSLFPGPSAELERREESLERDARPY